MNNLKMGNITPKWVKVLFPYLQDYFNKMTASEISRKISLPQQTTSRILNNLVKLNLLKYENKGKNKLFYFDFPNEKTKTLLGILEDQKALSFQLDNKISLIVNEIQKFCEGLIVFGSYASGKYKKDSDLDLVILGKSDKKSINSIKEKQIVEINEHYFSYEEFENLIQKNEPFILEVLKNHILFGDVSKIVKIFLRGKNE